MARLSQIHDRRHELVASAHPRHRRPQTWEEVHERLHESAGTGHDDDLRGVSLDRPHYGPSDLFWRRQHRTAARLQAKVIERPLTEAIALHRTKDHRRSGDAS